MHARVGKRKWVLQVVTGVFDSYGLSTDVGVGPKTGVTEESRKSLEAELQRAVLMVEVSLQYYFSPAILEKVRRFEFEPAVTDIEFDEGVSRIRSLFDRAHGLIEALYAEMFR